MRNRVLLVLGGFFFLVSITYAFNIFPFQIDFPKPRYEIFPSIPLEVGGEEFFVTDIRMTNLGGDTGTNVEFAVEFKNPIVSFESISYEWNNGPRAKKGPLDRIRYTKDKHEIIAGCNRLEKGDEIAIMVITQKENSNDEEVIRSHMYTDDKPGSLVDTYSELRRIEMKWKSLNVIVLASISSFFFTLFLTQVFVGSKKRKKDRRSHHRSSKSRLPPSTVPPPPSDMPGGGNST